MAKKKTKFDDAVAEMAERIARCFCAHGRVQCGIVYCLSRNDCEKVAAELQARTSGAGMQACRQMKRMQLLRRASRCVRRTPAHVASAAMHGAVTDGLRCLQLACCPAMTLLAQGSGSGCCPSCTAPGMDVIEAALAWMHAAQKKLAERVNSRVRVRCAAALFLKQ